jgi:hypothetical protein
MNGRQVAAKKDDALVPADEFDDVEATGLDHIRQEEMKPAFLYLLQQGSKAIIDGGPEYVEGAKPGRFLNTGTGKIYQTVEFVPVHRAMKFLEWVPVDDGGGFKGEHTPESEYVARFRTAANRFSSIPTDQGTELVQTFELYGLIGEPGFDLGSAELVNIPFTSIKIRFYTAWLDLAKKLRYLNSRGEWVTPPIYSHRFRLSSEFEQKWKPNGAWNVRIGLAAATKEAAFLRAADPLRQEAEKLYRLIEAGAVKADYAASDREPGADEDELPM